MGYCMKQVDGRVFVSKADFPKIVEAGQRLLRLLPTHATGRGSETDMRWWAFTDEVGFVEAARTGDAMDILRELRYRPVVDSVTGSIVGLEFTGQKYGDEDIILAELAPCFSDGDYIEMRGEEGALWRWRFCEGRVVREDALISWPREGE